jgi:hypothetical protein
MLSTRLGRRPIKSAKLDRKLEVLVTQPTYNRLLREAQEAGYQSLAAFLRVKLEASSGRATSE